MVDIKACAELSYQSYKDGGGVPPAGWSVLSATDPAASVDGFYAVAYQNASGEVVIAFRGTDDLQDLSTDIGILRNKAAAQFDQAVQR